MNVRSKPPNSKLIRKRFSILLVGIAGITAVWAFKRAIEPTVNQSSSIVELQPAKFSPQLYWLEINNTSVITNQLNKLQEFKKHHDIGFRTDKR